MASKKSPLEKGIYSMVSTTWHSGKSKTTETAVVVTAVKRSVVARNSRGGREAGMNSWSTGDF